jgi:hypothetical protein
MGWDSTRTVNWARLIREWLVYAVVMSGVFVNFLQDNVSAGSIAGLAASFPMYLIFGGALAKFGYQRKTLTDLRRSTPVRTPRTSRRSRGTTSQQSSPTKVRPAPTSRTTTGPSRHRSNKRKKR